ncbi:MAG: ThiF family adenylyltransferase, partial [Desulfosarcina sp.]|nr:ThiF family adenylyltransferase [Desulfobacterales bacterium]
MASSRPTDKIQARAVGRLRPDGSSYRSLSLAPALKLAREAGLDGYQLEAEALRQGILPERYARNTQALSLEDQRVLLESSACIVGLGGLGGTVAEVLARIGVGRLRLIDGDRFEEHNLNRQRFAHTGNLGRLKAQEAGKQIAQINPAAAVTARTVFLTDENA